VTAADFEHERVPTPKPQIIEVINETPEIEDERLRLRRLSKY